MLQGVSRNEKPREISRGSGGIAVASLVENHQPNLGRQVVGEIVCGRIFGDIVPLEWKSVYINGGEMPKEGA